MAFNWFKYLTSSKDANPATSTESEKKGLELPWSVSNYQYMLKSLGYSEDEKKTEKATSPEIQQILKYSGAALKVGRPINKVVIVVAGDSGAGKSSVINKLFHDGICATGYEAPETQKVSEYGKRLYVANESPPVRGVLSFIDTPGFDSVFSLEKESVMHDSFKSILSYRQNSVDLESRQALPQDNFVIREKVYPNVVLLVVRATDLLYVGEYSILWKKLRNLEDCEIVDKENVNFIVVVTHAMCLPCVEQRHKEVCEIITRIIQSAVKEILSISNVKTIFMENMPEDYGLKKEERSGFYKLPNGQLSHRNLIEAFDELFKANGDNLGSFLCGWYFTDTCPEKNQKPNVIISTPLDLPSSLVDFNKRKDAIGLPWDRRKRSPEGQLVVKYSGTALETGRPLNKVMILMAGQSGAGKSTTINSLFNAVVCTVSSEKSVTRTVTEYGVDLCVTAESPPVKGTLSFVDVPGSLDVDQSKEGVNLALIANFRQNHSDLASRKGLTQKFLPISEDVYPNLVLFIVQAGDNRMVGPDSHLKKSLRTLRQCRLLDRECTNLIVVVTHAAHLAIKEDIYIQKCAQTKWKIREAVWDVLQIMNVKVVFVENNPEEFGMVKGQGSDFYRLPDGQLSHQNLMQAINDHFKSNGDNLGRLLCAWYFADSCPEKKNEPKALHSVQQDIVTQEETKEAMQQFNTGMQAVAQEEGVPVFRFQYLGRGYCPKTETLKNVNVYTGTETKQVSILGKKYTVPKCVETVTVNENYYNQLSCKTREKYEKNRHASYGLEADVTLVVNVDSRGRWVQDKSSENVQSVITSLHETRLANVRMDEPEKNIKQKLMWALDYLPVEYNEDTAYIFNEFFGKWGSHFVCEEWIGGFIKVEESVTASTYDEKQEQELTKRLQFAVKGVNLPGNANVAAGGESNESKQEGRQEETITVSGGEPPSVKSLSEITSSMMSTWVGSIKEKPTELIHSVKLYPYYHLVEGMGKTPLREATMDYLSDMMAKKLKIKRDDISQQYLADVKSEECDKNCFPPTAKVYTGDGIHLAMKDLKPNNDILTVCHDSSKEVRSTPVLTYLHYDPKVTAEFLVIHMDNGKTLTITGNHLIFLHEDATVREIHAKQVQIGDEVVVITASHKHGDKFVVALSRVVKIAKTTLTGVYCPLTDAGTLVVDGVLVSCYANIDSHETAHLSMAPLRWWYKARGTLSTVLFRLLPTVMKPLNWNTGIHVYAKMMMTFCSLLPFKMLYDS